MKDNKKGTLRRPGATCRGAVGQHAVSMEPALGLSAAVVFTAACRYLSAPPFTMATDLRPVKPPPRPVGINKALIIVRQPRRYGARPRAKGAD
jgi:hypothetical protein